MKIVKEGSKKTRQFSCTICDCVFLADVGEYQTLLNNGGFRARCPFCNTYVNADFNAPLIDSTALDGVIGTWDGTPIHFCKCGGTPHIFGEGLARQDMCGPIGHDIYFVDFDGYAIECDECDELVYGFGTVEDALNAWNDKMEV